MYDYVIVGAGSAGCVLANRFTEDPTTTVLLLEAGGSDEAQAIHIPVAFSALFKTPLDWAYETAEQPHLHNRRLYWPRGKVLGGSSSINALVGMAGSSVYAASKAALHSLARTLCAELIGRGIRVNTITTGPTDTPIMKRADYPPEVIEAHLKTLASPVPVNRLGHPEEVAKLALFVASSDSSFVV